MQPFDFHSNKKRIEEMVNKHIKLAGIKDPEGFTLLEGFVAPIIHTKIEERMSLAGKLMPQVVVYGNSTGLVYYFYLDVLFPGEGLD